MRKLAKGILSWGLVLLVISLILLYVFGLPGGFVGIVLGVLLVLGAFIIRIIAWIGEG